MTVTTIDRARVAKLIGPEALESLERETPLPELVDGHTALSLSSRLTDGYGQARANLKALAKMLGASPSARTEAAAADAGQAERMSGDPVLGNAPEVSVAASEKRRVSVPDPWDSPLLKGFVTEEGEICLDDHWGRKYTPEQLRTGGADEERVVALLRGIEALSGPDVRLSTGHRVVRKGGEEKPGSVDFHVLPLGGEDEKNPLVSLHISESGGNNLRLAGVQQNLSYAFLPGGKVAVRGYSGSASHCIIITPGANGADPTLEHLRGEPISMETAKVLLELMRPFWKGAEDPYSYVSTSYSGMPALDVRGPAGTRVVRIQVKGGKRPELEVGTHFNSHGSLYVSDDGTFSSLGGRYIPSQRGTPYELVNSDGAPELDPVRLLEARAIAKALGMLDFGEELKVPALSSEGLQGVEDFGGYRYVRPPVGALSEGILDPTDNRLIGKVHRGWRCPEATFQGTKFEVVSLGGGRVLFRKDDGDNPEPDTLVVALGERGKKPSVEQMLGSDKVPAKYRSSAFREFLDGVLTRLVPGRRTGEPFDLHLGEVSSVFRTHHRTQLLGIRDSMGAELLRLERGYTDEVSQTGLAPYRNAGRISGASIEDNGDLVYRSAGASYLYRPSTESVPAQLFRREGPDGPLVPSEDPLRRREAEALYFGLTEGLKLLAKS